MVADKVRRCPVKVVVGLSSESTKFNVFYFSFELIQDAFYAIWSE
jgi:hypothetical protein